jgi:uncharacterized protein Veg
MSKSRTSSLEKELLGGQTQRSIEALKKKLIPGIRVGLVNVVHRGGAGNVRKQYVTTYGTVERAYPYLFTVRSEQSGRILSVDYPAVISRQIGVTFLQEGTEISGILPEGGENSETIN